MKDCIDTAQVLHHFEKIAKIPHCSFETEKMQEFLVDFAKNCGCDVSVDRAGNIHAYKGVPKVCLQSHYDMVCMGQAPKIEVLEDGGYLKAKDSSLGADNGIGVALMMEAMQKFENIECLFTNNEEVGLMGANDLEHQIGSKKLLNLDYENDSQVTIGCAGGVDLLARTTYTMQEKEGEVYEVYTQGFLGGHSGVDILDNPTNAIKSLAYFIAQNQGELIEFDGGERINSIPKYAKARVIFPTPPKEDSRICCQYQGFHRVQISSKGIVFLQVLNAFSHGLREFNTRLQIAQTSINLALASLKDGKVAIDLFARSNDEQELKRLEFETLVFFDVFGFDVKRSNFCPPWEIQESAFSQEVLDVMRVFNPKAQYNAIHAGLECGIIESKQKGLECCSIGPNIDYPHSTNERCEIASIEKIAKVVDEIVRQNQ